MFAIQRISSGRSGCRVSLTIFALVTVASSPVRGYHTFRSWRPLSSFSSPLCTAPFASSGLFRRDAKHSSATSSAALRVQQRCQGSLGKLLEDPNDVYLAAIMAYDLERIAELAKEDPVRDKDALFMHLIRPLAPAAARTASADSDDNSSPLSENAEDSSGGRSAPAPELDVAARKRDHFTAHPPPLTTKPAANAGEAVLQSLYNSGMNKLADHEAAERQHVAALKAEYEALTEAEKDTLHRARVAQHRLDALLAVNSILRTRVEVIDDGEHGNDNVKAKLLPAEDMAAIWAVHDCVKAMEEHVPAEKWANDFVGELEELAQFTNAMGATHSL